MHHGRKRRLAASVAPVIVAASLLAACSEAELDRMFPPSRSAPGGFEPVPPSSGPGASEETTERMPIDDSAPSTATPPG